MFVCLLGYFLNGGNVLRTEYVSGSAFAVYESAIGDVTVKELQLEALLCSNCLIQKI